jgi:hypothetical protein
MNTMNIRELLAPMIRGAVVGAGWVALSHIFSRPVGDGEVIGAAICAASTVAYLHRAGIWPIGGLQGMKKCQFCAEMIKSEAAVCRHCSRELYRAEVT